MVLKVVRSSVLSGVLKPRLRELLEMTYEELAETGSVRFYLA
jgi:hypothetical protein